MDKDIIFRLKAALFDWYGFDSHSKIYFVDEGNLAKDDKQVGQSEFDYIVCTVPLEELGTINSITEKYKILLKQSGIFIFVCNNRLGIRYFCGDKPKINDGAFESIVYGRSYDEGKGLYSKYEVEESLKRAGFTRVKMYAVLSNLDNPSHIFAEGFIPNEDIANRITPSYDSPDTVFLEEERLYRDLIKNGMFYSMANSFFVEASVSDEAVFSDVLQVTITADRKPEDAFYTIIHDDGTVSKEWIYSEGASRFKQMDIYAKDLRSRDLMVIKMIPTSKGICMPRIDAQTGQLAMKEALLSDKDKFITMMDQFRDCILKSSEIEYTDVKLGPIARYGYIDMVPLNSFYIAGNFVFFDQEFRLEHYPINVVIFRMVATFFAHNEDLVTIISREDMWNRYGLLKKKDLWHQMEWDFLNPLRNEKVLADYHANTRRNDGLMVRNRQRMNFSADRYLAVFSEVFSGGETKDIYVFGSGRYAERFMDWYSSILPIKGILDNDSNKWGDVFHDSVISSPEVLKDIPKDSYKVIICIKDYLPVIHQLDELGIECFSVYDGRKILPEHFIVINAGKNALESKPYHKGYVAGAFDMFHIGHLNLFRRAKERCEYLVVGVMSDEKMLDLKGKKPVIPCNERIQIVAGCRYVDEVIELPIDKAGISDAYKMVHFDCMFSGDDHANDPGWLAERDNMRRKGSDIVFVPYTEETSSTQIRDKIENKVIRREDMEDGKDIILTWRGNR